MNVRFTPKADIGTQPRDVCFVPKADILRCGKERRYSITSSAMATRPGGKVRPSAFAVVRLMNSSLVDCMTGRSAGFSLGSGAAINWRYSTNSSAMDPRGARAALDARAPAERADGRGEEVARGAHLASNESHET